MQKASSGYAARGGPLNCKILLNTKFLCKRLDITQPKDIIEGIHNPFWRFPMSRKYRTFIKSGKSYSIIFDTGNPMMLTSEHPLFPTVDALIKEGRYDALGESVTEADRIKLHSKGRFYVGDDGIVYLVGSSVDEAIPAELSKMIVSFADAAADFEPLIKFWERLKQNPSEDSKKDLYSFLLHNDVPITEDGKFICWKRVKSDFTDIRTGKFNNAIGERVWMPREDVDPDRTVACSRGLHVAAFHYAKYDYYSYTGILIECEVDPVNVVAVPLDYDCKKMRVCEYVPIRQIETEYKGKVYNPNPAPLVDETPDWEDYDEDVYDEIDDIDESDLAEIEEDTVVEPVKVGKAVHLYPNLDKRYNLPKSIMSAIGVRPGDEVGAFVIGKTIVITSTTDDPSAVLKQQYKADHNGSIRVSNQLLSHVGMNDRNQIKAQVMEQDSELRIVLKK